MGQPFSPVWPVQSCVQILAPPFGPATQRCPLTLQSLSAMHGVPMTVARVQPPATSAIARQTMRSIDLLVSQSVRLDNDGARSRNRWRRASMRLGRLSILVLPLVVAACGPPSDPTPNRAPPSSSDYPPPPYGYAQG